MKKIICIAAAAAVCISPVYAAEDTHMRDSGINYTELAETLDNPGAGYTSPVWYECRPGDTPVKNPSGSLVVLFVDIGAFSSGVNGVKDEATGEYTEGTDYDLDESFFRGLRGTLENCRKNGSAVGLRFRYDALGKSNPEPASFDRVLSHIRQIDEDGVLTDYEDILIYVESGFAGAWGEQHSGKYTSVEYKAQLLDAVLKIVPESVCVSVRTPDTFCRWAGIKTDELADYRAEPGSQAARVGIYNDGYMGSDSDLGTFGNPSRESAVKWMENHMLGTVYGGEFSGNTDFAMKYKTYLPENAVPEMYRTHLSYINSNIWGLYKDMEFGEYCDVKGTDNSAYYGKSVYSFIRDHIGYRFVLRDSRISAEAEQGGNFEVHIKVENTGFARSLKKHRAQIILEKDGEYLITDSDADDMDWLPQSVSEEKFEIKLPGNIPEGKWNVYLRLSLASDDMRNAGHRTVKFANEGVYSSSLGASLIGSIDISATDSEVLKSDTTFSEKGADNVSDGTVYSYRGLVTADGYTGQYEWPDETVLAENENCRLNVSSDSEYMYVRVSVPDTASAPVYNLQLKGAEGSREYWIYYASNGFVYFNGGSYDGITCGFRNGVAEWKIPLDGTMELEPGRELSYIRAFVQDSADGWKVTGDLKTGSYTPGTAFSKGDVNGDGVINTADFTTLCRYLLGGGEAVNTVNSDMNEDGSTGVADLILLKNMLTK